MNTFRWILGVTGLMAFCVGVYFIGYFLTSTSLNQLKIDLEGNDPITTWIKAEEIDQNINKLEFHISGTVLGKVLIKFGDDESKSIGEFELKTGFVRESYGGEWNSGKCFLTLIPQDSVVAHLTIDYKFYESEYFIVE